MSCPGDGTRGCREIRVRRPSLREKGRGAGWLLLRRVEVGERQIVLEIYAGGALPKVERERARAGHGLGHWVGSPERWATPWSPTASDVRPR